MQGKGMGKERLCMKKKLTTNSWQIWEYFISRFYNLWCCNVGKIQYLLKKTTNKVERN